MHENGNTIIAIFFATCGGTFKAITLQVTSISWSASCSVIVYAALSALTGLMIRAAWNKIFKIKK